jgi:hypothetical protein
MTKDVRKLFTISIRDQNIDYEIRNTKKKRNSNIKCQNSSGTTLQFLHATRYSFYATLSIFFFLNHHVIYEKTKRTLDVKKKTAAV